MTQLKDREDDSSQLKSLDKRVLVTSCLKQRKISHCTAVYLRDSGYCH